MSKSNSADGALKDAPKPTPDKVRDAEAVPGATLKAVNEQDGGNADPKHRSE